MYWMGGGDSTSKAGKTRFWWRRMGGVYRVRKMRKRETRSLPASRFARFVSRARQVLNSGRLCASCAWRRATMLECIWLTRDSLRSSVAPISFIVMSS